MAVIGSQLMMLKHQIAERGMLAVLRDLAAIGIEAVEVSQVPLTEQHIADLETGVRELGVEVGALSVQLRGAAGATPPAVDPDLTMIAETCQRLGTRFVRIGIMPFEAMVSPEACEAWAADCQAAAEQLAGHGITLCYHNHHIDLAQFTRPDAQSPTGQSQERIFDLVRRVAPGLHFEVDLHWVQRGGMAPLDMLAAYSGVCKLIHVKDFRVVPPSADLVARIAAGDESANHELFNGAVQFAEVGQGNMDWPALLPAARAAGAEYFFIEQDETYGRDPLDCVRDSRQYLRSIGW